MNAPAPYAVSPYPLRTLLAKSVLSLVILPFTATYSFCFIWQSNSFLQTIVIGATLFMLCLAWYRFKLAVFFYIFCIPLFNTMTQILQLEWPGFSVNAIMLSALFTSWIHHYIWHKPITDEHPDIYCIATPVDAAMLSFAAVVLLSLPLGWFRFNNVFSPGFYPDALSKLAAAPFFTLFDNYLCFTRAWQFFLIILSFYMVASTLRLRRDIRTALWLILSSGCLVCIYGIIQRQTGFRWVGVNWFFERINATLNGPDSAALYFAALVILCATLPYVFKKLYQRLVIFCGGLISIVGLILTSTRTAMFALLLVLALLVFITTFSRFINTTKVRLLALALLIIVLFLAPGNTLRLPGQTLWPAVAKSRYSQGLKNFDFSREKMDELFSYRGYHWTAAARVICRYPLAGAGIGTFDKLYKSVKNPRDSYKTAFAHSLYLDVYAETGVPGLLVLLLIYAQAIILSWNLFAAPQSAKHTKALGLAFLAIALMTFLANFFTSSFYYVPELQLWFTVLFVVLVRTYQIHFSPETEALSSRIQTFFTSLLSFLRASKPCATIVLSLCACFLLVYICALVASIRFGHAFFITRTPYTKIDGILEYGIFHYEKDQNNNKFARTARNVYKPVSMRNRYLRLFLRADHPDAELKPVNAAIYLNNAWIGDVAFSNRTWSLYTFDLKDHFPTLPSDQLLTPSNAVPAVLHMRSSRTWNPFDSRKGYNDLDYGIDLGAIEWGYY